MAICHISFEKRAAMRPLVLECRLFIGCVSRLLSNMTWTIHLDEHVRASSDPPPELNGQQMLQLHIYKVSIQPYLYWLQVMLFYKPLSSASSINANWGRTFLFSKWFECVVRLVTHHIAMYTQCIVFCIMVFLLLAQYLCLLTSCYLC